MLTPQMCDSAVKDTLRVGTLNIRGLRGHEDEVVGFFESEALDILVLQETRLPQNGNYNYSRLGLPNVLLPPGNKCYGMGVVFREGLLVDVSVGVTDVCMFIRVNLDTATLLIANCYCRPNSPQSFSQVAQALRSSENYDYLMLLGDFNARYAGEHALRTNVHGRLLSQLESRHGLARLPVSKPSTTYGTLLDYVLLDGNLGGNAYVAGVNVGSSDHFPVVSELTLRHESAFFTTGRSWNGKAVIAHQEAISRRLSLAMDNYVFPAQIRDSADVTRVYQWFLNTVHGILESTIGVQKKRPKVNVTDGEIRRLTLQRDALAAELQLSKQECVRKVLQKTQEALDRAKKDHARSRYFNWKQMVNHSIPADQSKILSSTFKHRVPRLAPPLHSIASFMRGIVGERSSAEKYANYAPQHSAGLEFAQSELIQILAYSSGRKAQGQDDIPSWFLKRFSHVLAPWLTRFFSLLTRCQLVPLQWQKGKVIFLPKDGSMKPDRFRPITILSRVRLLFERMLLSHFKSALETDAFQGGFKPGHRCHHWVGMLHDVMQVRLRSEKQLFVAKLDCAKAFDTIEFAALLNGLPVDFRFRQLVSGLTCFQRQRLHGSNIWLHPSRGTPQGGVLSPLLFNKGIDGLASVLNTLPKVEVGSVSVNRLQWADDLILLADSPAHLAVLVNATRDFLSQCGLALNVSKSELLVMKSQGVESVAEIPVVNDLTYLGVIFNKNGINAAKDLSERRTKLLRSYAVIRNIGFYPGGFSPYTRLLIAKTFLIPRITYGLPVYPETAVAPSSLDSLDKELVRWTLGRRVPVETGLTLLRTEPLKEMARRYRYKLRANAMPKIAKTLSNVTNSLIRKRIAGVQNRFVRLVFRNYRLVEPPEWTPSLKTARQATSLNHSELRRLDSQDQSLIFAFLCNKYPAKGPVCRKCSLQEHITRGHLKRCPYLARYTDGFDWDNPCSDLGTLQKILSKVEPLLWTADSSFVKKGAKSRLSRVKRRKKTTRVKKQARLANAAQTPPDGLPE